MTANLVLSFHILLLLLCHVVCDSSNSPVDDGNEEVEQQEQENYNPEDLLSKIFGLQNDTQARQVGGYGLVQNQGPGQPVHFPDGPQDYYDSNTNNQQFQHNNQNPQKVPRKRRKKPRYDNQYAGQYGYYNYGLNQQLPPGFQGQNGFQTNGVYRPELGTRFGPETGGGRPASLTASALSSLTEALSSIARNDDYQCVPRLLCEVAAGERPGQSSGGSIFSSLLNMQPLVTLLSAYNGMSSSPLFTFGKAALLGFTSQGNSASCIYAYPQCPRDTDHLINYLNNHNGGFFRFFNGLNQQINQPGYPQATNQNNGALSNFIQNTLGNFNSEQSLSQFGHPQNNLQQQNLQQNLGFNNINHGQSYYNQLYQNLGSINSNHGSHSHNVRFRRERKKNPIGNNRLQDRIQNNYSNDQISNEETFALNSASIEADEDKNNLRFPDDNNSIFSNYGNIPDDGVTNGNLNSGSNSQIRFPDNLLNVRYAPEISVFNRRRPKKIKFPLDSDKGVSELYDTQQSVFQSGDNGVRYEPSGDFHKTYDRLKAEFIANFENSNSGPDFSFGSESGFNSNSETGFDYETSNSDVVYVVRGNGDPNHPEVVRFKS